MSKPSWDVAPEWAQWLAVDSSGKWHWYEFKPWPGIDMWHEAGGRFERVGPATWGDSLEPRP